MNLSRDCGISATPPIAEPSAGISCGRFSVISDPAAGRLDWRGSGIKRGVERGPCIEGGHDGFRVMVEVMARFGDEAGPGGVTQSAMGSGQISPAKTAIGPATGIPARNGLRNDPCANQLGYQ